MTLKHDGPIFFFSYGRADGDDHLQRFFQDLCNEVRGLLGLPGAHPVGFRDTHGIKTGDRWPEELSSALSTCQILLPLYSRSFFNSEYCGKEWSAFRSRLSAAGGIPKLILPALWKPLGASFENLPKEIREIQYSFAELGETYRIEGLQYLLRLDEQKDNYQKFLVAFAKRMVDAAESYPLEPADPPLDIEKFPNAFTAPDSAPVTETTIARSTKRTRGYYMPRGSQDREPAFIEVPDDFLARVERVCRLRESSAEIERISREDDSWDYLRVSVRHGEIVKDYPVAGVEYDISLEDLNAFCDQIAKRFPGAVSYLIYGGAPAPEGLQSVATKRDVRLMSFIEYMGLIDFRGYLRKQTDDLSRDKLYPPSLYVTQRMISLERNEEHPDALAKLQDWLATPNRRFAVILGDFGTGKTFLLHELARRMGLAESGPVPVLLQMRSLEKGRTLAQLLGQHFAQDEPVGYRFERFRFMLEQGQIVLLFDGFDELALRVTYERAAEHFETLLSAAQGDAKIVVTSRRQHFISDQQVRSKLGEEVELISGSRIGILQTFSRDQIRAFLVNRCANEAEAEARLELIDSIKDLIGLSENPRMLGFIADLPEEQLRQAAAGGEITAATLYRLILERWLVHEFDRVHPKGAPPGLSVQDRWNAVTLLAVRLWQKTDRFVNLEEIQADAAEAIRKMDRAFDEAVAAFQVGSGTLLVRDDEGNFSFLHQSILEWLIAREAAEKIKGTGRSQLLAIRDVSPLMIDFFVGLAGKNVAVEWAQQALVGEDETTARNSLLLLTRLKLEIRYRTDLSGQDLSGQDFSGQDLSGALLEGTNFNDAKMIRTTLNGALLKEATLRRADLSRSELRSANLASTDFSQARLLGTDLTGAHFNDTLFLRAKLIGASLKETEGLADFSGSAQEIPDLLEGFVASSVLPQELAWSPDEQLLAIARSSMIEIWEVPSGELIRSLKGDPVLIRSLAFINGGRLISGDEGGTARIWSLDSGGVIMTLPGNAGRITSVATTSDGTIIASVSSDKAVCIWEVDSGKLLHTLKAPQSLLGVAFRFDLGDILVGISNDGTITNWSIDTGRSISSRPGYLGQVKSVSFSYSADRFVTVSQDNSVRLWDTESGRKLRSFRDLVGHAECIALSPDGKTLAIGSKASIRLWNTDSGHELTSFEEHQSWIRNLTFSEGGEFIASTSDDNTVWIWRPLTRQLVRPLRSPKDGVWSVAFNPDGNSLASTSPGNLVRFWRIDSGSMIGTIQGRTSRILGVAYSPNGELLASASNDSTVRIWRTNTGSILRSLKGHKESVWCVAFSPDGQIVASGSEDNTARLWQLESGEEIYALQGHYRGVLGVAFSSDGKMLATASYDNDIRLWDTSSGEEVGVLHGHDRFVRGVAFSPDGSMLASASYDKTIRLWNLDSRDEIRTLRGHQGGALSVAFNSSGEILASSSYDNTVRLWEPASGREISRFQGHQGGVLAIAFSPSGNTLASASLDNTVRLWDVATGRCIVILAHLPEGWVAFTPDGRYKYGGVIAGGFWHAINLCRFEVGELDEFVPGLRLPDDASFFDLPPVPPWVQAREGER